MKIEFIIATHKHLDHLKAMLLCLKNQTNPNWIATVALDGTNQQIQDYIFDEYDSRINICVYDLGPCKDWGHTAIQNAKEIATEKLLVMTSDDNYYVPHFVDEFLKIFQDPRITFAYCDMVHNSFDYHLVKTEIARAKIDLGSFVTLTQNAKQIRLKKGYEDDYTFARDYVSVFCPNSYNIHTINKVLYVHN